MFTYYTHVNSEVYVAVADLLPILQGDNDQLSTQYRVKATLTNYIRLYTLLIIYLYIYYIPTSHTPESYRRYNFLLRNCQVFPIKTTRHQNTLTKHVNQTRQQNTSTKHVNKTLQQNTSTKHVNKTTRQHGIILPRLIRNLRTQSCNNNSLLYSYRAIMAYRATKQ